MFDRLLLRTIGSRLSQAAVEAETVSYSETVKHLTLDELRAIASHPQGQPFPAEIETALERASNAAAGGKEVNLDD